MLNQLAHRYKSMSGNISNLVRVVTRNRLFLVSLVGIVFLYVFLYLQLNQGLLSHSYYDSYTLQAMAWLQGRVSLEQDYSSLELALYEDRVFVSFPPFPSVILVLLVPFFGQETPNNLLSTLYTVLSYVFAFLYCIGSIIHWNLDITIYPST